jgi:WD40 repeat protein
MLALGFRDGRVKLVDELTGEVRREVDDRYTRHSRTSMAMSPNGRFVVVVNDGEHHWHLWDAAAPDSPLRSGPTHDRNGVCRCKLTRSGPVFDKCCPLLAHSAGLTSVVFSLCGQRFATGCKDGAVVLWDAHTGEAERRFQGLPHTPTSARHPSHILPPRWDIHMLCFSADGSRIVCAACVGSVFVLDTATGAVIRDCGPQEKCSTWVQFSPVDNSILAIVNQQDAGPQSITLLDVDSGEVRKLPGGSFAAFAPDGRTIATRSVVWRAVDLVDFVSGQHRETISIMDTDHVGQVIFSGDGRKLITCSFDSELVVWDAAQLAGPLLHTDLDVLSNFRVLDPSHDPNKYNPDKFINCVSWGRDWIRETQRELAFVMGHDARLGAESQVLGLDAELMRMILALVLV